jgi:putative iron-regulated protein
LGVLAKGELAGERMFVAIDTRDQENEHSCFSDNTIMDIKMNLLGISNVYYGQYIRVNSTSIKGKAIRDLIRLKSPETADLIDQAFADATAKVNLIPAPFDQTIVNNPESVLPAINALRLLSDNIVEGGFKIGVVL